MNMTFKFVALHCIEARALHTETLRVFTVNSCLFNSYVVWGRLRPETSSLFFYLVNQIQGTKIVFTSKSHSYVVKAEKGKGHEYC